MRSLTHLAATSAAALALVAATSAPVASGIVVDSGGAAIANATVDAGAASRHLGSHALLGLPGAIPFGSVPVDGGPLEWVSTTTGADGTFAVSTPADADWAGPLWVAATEPGGAGTFVSVDGATDVGIVPVWTQPAGAEVDGDLLRRSGAGPDDASGSVRTERWRLLQRGEVVASGDNAVPTILLEDLKLELQWVLERRAPDRELVLRSRPTAVQGTSQPVSRGAPCTNGACPLTDGDLATPTTITPGSPVEIPLDELPGAMILVRVRGGGVPYLEVREGGSWSGLSTTRGSGATLEYVATGGIDAVRLSAGERPTEVAEVSVWPRDLAAEQLAAVDAAAARAAEQLRAEREARDAPADISLAPLLPLVAATGLLTLWARRRP